MKVLEISSSTNSNYQMWLDLLDGKGVKKQGLCLVGGRKIVAEVLPHATDAVVLCTKKTLDTAKDLATDKIALLSAELFRQLDEFGTGFPLLVCALPKINKIDLTNPPSGWELLLSLQDPQNVGAAIRSAMAFGVDKIVCLRECANPFLTRVTRAASGLNFVAPLFSSVAEMNEMAEVTALDMDGENLFEMKAERNLRLWVGEEGRGIPSDFKGKRIKIPMDPRVESLNAAVAVGISLAHYTVMGQFSV